MLILSVILNIILSIVSGILFFYYSSYKDREENLKNDKNKIEEQLQEKILEIEDLRKKIDDLVHYKGQFMQMERQYEILEERSNEYQEKMQSIQEKQFAIEKRASLVEQDRNTLKREQDNWEKERENLLKSLSYKLMKEAENLSNKNSQNNQEKLKEIVSDLTRQFEDINNKVSSLNDDTKKAEFKIDNFTKTFFNPSGAGLTAETTLENILRASNLKRKLHPEDDGSYIMQESLSGDGKSRKRPDAVVYLPNNQYLIIDSKSSVHFLGLQEAIDAGDKEMENEILRKLKDRMNQNLRELQSKDYVEAKLANLKVKDHHIPPTAMTVMFVPTEKMLEIIRNHVDKDFELKCYEAEIPVLSPIGLVNLLNSARFSIMKDRQDKSFVKIKEQTKMLLTNISSILKKAGALGTSLNKAMENYNDLANISNRNIPARYSNLSKLGIETKKDLETRLVTYERHKEYEFNEEENEIEAIEE